jgi:hydroxypyruvate isomerase
MPKFAANLTMMFNEVPFLDRFAAAAEAGFTAVEFLFPYAYTKTEVRARLREAGLLQVLFNLPPGDWGAGERGLAALPGRQAEFRESVAKALEYAEALECPRLHAMAGIVPADLESKICEDVYVENLRFAARAARSAGVRIMIEPINARDMPGYFLSRTEHARRIIEAVSADNLFLQYDIYHAQISEGFLVETFRANRSFIGHVQIAGVPGRYEPDAEQEINYPFVLAAIDAAGYDGWIGCEYRPRAGTVQGLNWLAPFGSGARHRPDRA